MNVTLFWDINIGVVSYAVEYKLHSSSTWISAGGSSDNFITISGLSSCQYYDFRVTPQCAHASYGAPTVTSNVYTETGNCTPNSFVFFKFTNAIQPGNLVYFSEIHNDLGISSTTGMPVVAGSNYTMTQSFPNWYTNVITVRFYNGAGNTTFHLNVYRNGVYYSTITINASSSTNTDITIVLDHALAPNDLIEFILNF